MKKDAIQELVNQAFQQHHSKKQLLILRLLVKLVNARAIEVRFVVEFMLSSLVYSDQTLNNNYLINATNQNNLFNSSATNINLQKTIQTINKKPTSPYLWLKVMECVRKCTPLHDYKACRDIFKMLLDLVKRIPHSSSSYPPILKSEQSLTEISSRKAKSDRDFAKTKELMSRQSTDNDQDIKLDSLYEVK